MTGILHKISDNIVFPYQGKLPVIGKNVFIAEGVKIIGDVTIQDNCSIWFNTVIRGDVHYIKIGKNTNIQDLSMLHVTNGKFPLTIGENVTIGHSVKLHGCTIGNNVLIGIGAIILDGCVVEENTIIAAGAVVTPGSHIPSGVLAGGIPSKIFRDLSVEEIRNISDYAKRYLNYAKNYIQEKLIGENNG